MFCDPFNLATPGILDLKPYQPGKTLEALEREYGITNAIKLASNENPLGPSPEVVKYLQSSLAAKTASLYPDGSGLPLKFALSELHGVTPEMITLGNGSNDILDLIARLFLLPGSAAVFSRHAFAMFYVVTKATSAEMVIVPDKNWTNDTEAILQAIDDTVKVIFFANPDNPTGTWTRSDELYHFLQRVPGEVIVVLDEAYAEYQTSPDYPKTTEWLSEFSNLIISRTFSKAYGLAGLRLGYAMSSEKISDLLNRVRQPFNVNNIAMEAAQVALGDQKFIKKVVNLNNSERERISKSFERIGLRYIKSACNFITLHVGIPGVEVFEQLLYEGIIVRPLAGYGMPECLRISIGLPEENDQMIKALAKVLNIYELNCT